MPFTDAEKAILTTLAESDLRLPPKVIAENTGNSGGYIRQRCKELADRGLVQDTGTTGKPYYEITDAGRQALADEEGDG